MKKVRIGLPDGNGQQTQPSCSPMSSSSEKTPFLALGPG